MAGQTRVWKNLREVTVERLAQENELEFSSLFTVTSLKKGCLYHACPNELCGLALVALQEGCYLCKSCSLESPHFQHKLMVKAEIVDTTGTLWIMCFEAAAEQILRQATACLVELKKKEADEDVFQKAPHEEPR